jgi:uncharacterized protein YecT (DUF1311 family)
MPYPKFTKKSWLWCCILLCLLSAPPVAAGDADTCVMAAQTQADINECSTQRYKAADSLLNRTYKEIQATVDSGQFAKIRQAQRAWITYRDTACEAQALAYATGSLYTSVYTNCLTDMTRVRTAKLREVYLHAKTTNSVGDQRLAGTWHALANNYGLEITFGISHGVHHYFARLNNLPYEAGQWHLADNQLTITSSKGKLLHTYIRILLEDDVLSLHEDDGGVSRFKKIQ